MNIKMAFFIPTSIDYGFGGEYWTYYISRNLKALNVDVSVVGLKFNPIRAQAGLSDEIIKEGIRYIELGYIKPPYGAAFVSPSYLSFLNNFLTQLDVVYIMATPPNDLLFYIVKELIKTDTPFFVFGYHTYPSLKNYLEKTYVFLQSVFLRTIDLIHVMNRSLLKFLRGKDLFNVFYLPNGVDTNLFKKKSNIKEQEKFTIVYTGRLSTDKGFDRFLRLILALSDRPEFRKMRVLITGRGPYDRYAKKLAKKYHNVEYLGYVNRSALPKVYNEGSVYTLISREGTEQFPLRLLEAVACGLPFIATEVGEVRYLTDMLVGYTVPPDSDESIIKLFIKNILKLFELWSNNRYEYEMLSRTNSEKVQKYFSWETISKKFLNIVLKALMRSGDPNNR